MRKRRAISLIELLAVLSGCSVVLGLTASLLHQTMRAQSHTRDFFDVERNAQRLARQFRSDVHAADAASIDAESDGDSDVFRLQLPAGQTVEYQRVAEKIIRIAAQEGAPTAREVYSLGESMDVDVNELNSPQRWVLSITTTPPQPSKESPPTPARIRETPVNLEVEAIPGRDLRYAPPAASGEEAT